MGVPEPIECPVEIPKLVGRKFPVSILFGPPDTLVTGLYRGDHQVADARQIPGGLRRGRFFWPSGHAARRRKTDHQDGGCGNRDRANYDLAAPHASCSCPDPARTRSLLRRGVVVPGFDDRAAGYPDLD